MRFADLPLAQPLQRALAARGYDVPTPVQQAMLDPAHRTGDLLVSSRTGSGKTVAFGLALADMLLEAGVPPAGAPLALVVAPTRELAMQVQRELQWLLAETGARVAACVGGTDVRREQRRLAEGAHVVVGTPGRLCDHLDRSALDLRELQVLVLDEADEMLDMGFRDELEAILGRAPAKRRTLLFSATLPRGIEELAARYQKDATRIAATAEEAHRDIEYRLHTIAPREREHAVVNVLRFHDAPRSLVFCATREGVARMQASLAERGFPAAALSGDLGQGERNRALQALRDGAARVLVATDVAARGLDLPEVGLVVHADLPVDAAVLQHRSGRTGRAGRKGVAVLLVPGNRRRTAERLVREAKVQPKWSPVPRPEQIAARDRVALLADVAALVGEVSEEERALARELIAAHDAEALVAALVRVEKAKRPAPEELPLTEELARRGATQARAEAPVRKGRGFRGEGFGREGVGREGLRCDGDGFDAAPGRGPRHRREFPGGFEARGDLQRRGFDRRSRGGAAEGGERPPRRSHDRAGAERPQRRGGSGVWFKVNVGRTGNADPRWLVPMICRRGKIAKDAIGRIEILPGETRFEIAPAAAEHFDAWARRPDRKDPNLRFEPVARGA